MTELLCRRVLYNSEAENLLRLEILLCIVNLKEIITALEVASFIIMQGN